MVVSVIVPVRNDAERLARCLAALAANGYPADRLEVIVVDNGSTDGSADRARRTGARVVIRRDARVGALRNEAAAISRGDVLAFVDADHEVDSSWLSTAVELLEDAAVGAVGAPYRAPAGATWVQQWYDTFRDHRPGRHETAWLGSGNMAIKKTLFDRLGGFDTTLAACEDVDLCRRLRAAGYRVLADARLGSVHFGDPATLGTLFRAELWRGRDNVRVSCRRPIALGELPSALAPIIGLGGLAAMAAGVVAAPLGGLPVAGAAALLIATVASLRAIRMTRRRGRRRSTLLGAIQSFTVALVYDAARALALVARAGHHRAGRPRMGARG